MSFFLLLLSFVTSSSFNNCTHEFSEKSIENLKFKLSCGRFTFEADLKKRNCTARNYRVYMDNKIQNNVGICLYDGFVKKNFGKMVKSNSVRFHRLLNQWDSESLSGEMTFGNITYYTSGKHMKRFKKLQMKNLSVQKKYHPVPNAVFPIGITADSDISIKEVHGYLALIIPKISKIYWNQFGFKVRVAEIRFFSTAEWKNCSSKGFRKRLQTARKNFPKFSSKFAPHWHILSRCEFKTIGGVSGVATVGNSVSVSISLIHNSFRTMAHELGHALGAHHDDEPGFLMYKSLTNSTIEFSPQSKFQISQTLKNHANWLMTDAEFAHSLKNFDSKHVQKLKTKGNVKCNCSIK